MKIIDEMCQLTLWRAFNPVPDQVKSSFVIFDIRALWRSALSVRVPGCQKLQMRLNPVWHRMLYSCTHMASVGVKGLTHLILLRIEFVFCDLSILGPTLQSSAWNWSEMCLLQECRGVGVRHADWVCSVHWQLEAGNNVEHLTSEPWLSRRPVRICISWRRRLHSPTSH